MHDYQIIKQKYKCKLYHRYEGNRGVSITRSSRRKIKSQVINNRIELLSWFACLEQKDTI